MEYFLLAVVAFWFGRHSVNIDIHGDNHVYGYTEYGPGEYYD